MPYLIGTGLLIFLLTLALIVVTCRLVEVKQERDDTLEALDGAITNRDAAWQLLANSLPPDDPDAVDRKMPLPEFWGRVEALAEQSGMRVSGGAG